MKTYKAYENQNLMKDYAKLLTMSKEEVEIVMSEWEEVRSYNSVARRENELEYFAEIKSIATELSAKGIEVYKPIKRNKKEREFTSWFNNYIATPLRTRYLLTRFPGEPSTNYSLSSDYKVEINGVTISRIFSNNLLQIWDSVQRSYKTGIESMKRTNAEYNKCIKFALENDILVNIDSSPNEIISTITKIASEKWLKCNYTEGELINIDCCSECNEYYYGEHRCSCGNRRINSYVEGTIGDFYLVTETY